MWRTTNTYYHIVATAGWFIFIAGALFAQKPDLSGFLEGLGGGLALGSYFALFVSNRKKKQEEKNEAASR